ncbi:DUF4124 domain-containing protein [Pseudomonas sp. nanlin1]|uniref:DUF4124 domain-containing protein n=1 Tax=Pseudomonas sp. nanlin1 TaxID=3040605 RepID=UPI00388E39E1
MRSCLICLLLLVALPAGAQIYKYTDAAGNTAYSNQKPEGIKAETVELPPLNSIESQPRTAPEPSKQAPPAMPQQPPYAVLELTGIPSEEALRANNGTFTVGVDLQPRLFQGHSFQLVLDGKPYGQPSNVPRLQLVNIDRGEHSLAVQIISGTRVIQQSETLTFTVQRVHL